MKSNKTIKRNPLGLVACFGLLGLLTVLMLCPGARTDVAAEGEVTETSTTQVRVLLKPVISVALAARVDVDVVPTSTGNWGVNSMDLTVATNNSSGFAVLMNGIGGTDLEPTSSTNASKIQSITAETDQSGFGANTWGAYVGSSDVTATTLFKPVTESATQMTVTEEANARNNYKLAFGTKVNTEIPADTYLRQVLVSVVANPLEVDSLSNMVYMQDMKPEICEHSTIGETTQLIDTRDGNKYWVAKLKDERCWMVQNLALTFGDPNANKTFVNKLTPDDSDVTANWSFTEGAGVKMRNTEFTVPSYQASPSQTETRSWNLGKWALATPLATTSCGDVSNIATCTKVGFVDVSDSTKFSPGYVAEKGKNWDGANPMTNTTVAVNCTAWSGTGAAKICTAGTYDEHYLIGNYYQFNAATAGSGGSIANADAADSVCPKGWQLPTAGSQADGKSGSFQNMLSKYGLASAVSGSADGVSYNIADSPLYFVRSGRIYLAASAGTFGYAGQYGHWWSSRAAAYTSGTSATAYSLSFNDTTVSPSNGPSARFYGFSLRCLSTVSDR